MTVALTNQNQWYDVATQGPISTSFSGYTLSWTNVIQGRWTSVSGNTYSVQYRCIVRKHSGNLTTNTSSYNGYSIGGTGAGTVSTYNTTLNFPNTGDNVIATTSGTITGTSGTISGGITIGYYGSTWGDTDILGSFTLPATSSAPTGLTASNLVPGSESFTADVSLVDWGIGGQTASRYKELSVREYNESSLSTNRRYAIALENTLSSTMTTDNNGVYVSMYIVGNTRYTLSLYATNGAVGTGAVRWRDAVTLPYKPLVSLYDMTETTATFFVRVRKDGGFYSKKLFYSLDGTNWTLFGEVNNGDYTELYFTVPELSVGQSYTVRVKAVTQAGETSADNFTFYSYASNPRFYGSDSIQRSANAKVFYSSVSSLATNTEKIYASENNQAKLVFYGGAKRSYFARLPETPYGRVYYTETASYDTIKYVELQSVAEFESLCAPDSSTYSWTATVGSGAITVSSRGSTNYIVGIDIGTKITSIPNFFLLGCSRLFGNITVPDNVVTIGTYFASRCGNSFNGRLNVINLGKNVTSFGAYCLAYSYFSIGSSAILLPEEATSVSGNFLYGAYYFDSAITIPKKVTSIGAYFLYGCGNFNSKIILNNQLSTIGAYFLYENTSFNKDIKLPNTLTSIGTYFMYRCNAMTSTIYVNDVAASVASSSNYTFGTPSKTTPAYVTGIKIAGSTRTDWLLRFPSRTSSPYRKLLNAGY